MERLPTIVGCAVMLLAAPVVLYRIVRQWRNSGKYAINLEPTSCPRCPTRMPMVRFPRSWRQTLWGGWTCARCGCEMDRYGKPLS